MHRVLIIKLGALGDVVMATPLVEAIQKFHPQADIHLLTTPAFMPLFNTWAGLEHMSFPRRGWLYNADVVRWLRRGGFDRIYDLQGNDRTGLWCALSGAPERVGNHNRYPYTHHPPSRWRGQCHIFDRMVEVLASAGVSEVGRLPSLPCEVGETQHVEHWLDQKNLESQRIAVLHAGASAKRPAKIWPHFTRLALRLAARGLSVVWIGGEADRESNAVGAAQTGIDATGEFEIAEIAVLGRHARFAVTNDSGPMHILSASGIPVFGLFGPSDWRRNHALGQAERAIACVDYATEFKGEPLADCLASVTVDDVWARLAAEDLV